MKKNAIRTRLRFCFFPAKSLIINLFAGTVPIVPGTMVLLNPRSCWFPVSPPSTFFINTIYLVRNKQGSSRCSRTQVYRPNQHLFPYWFNQERNHSPKVMESNGLAPQWGNPPCHFSFFSSHLNRDFLIQMIGENYQSRVFVYLNPELNRSLRENSFRLNQNFS